MNDVTKLTSATDVSRALYGGVLDFDAAGHYPGLELLNLVFCEADGTILPESDEVKIARRSHEFGRRLVWDAKFDGDARQETVLLEDEAAEETLRELLRCLQLEIPSGAKEPKWSRAHLFPYTPSMIHWDATSRAGGRISIERIYLRGGGALAYKILRRDPDRDRLERVRNGFSTLYKATAESPLEVLASFLGEQSNGVSEAATDKIEKDSVAGLDDFEDVYRDGIATILEQSASTSVAKVRAVMGWTALWLVLMQQRRTSQSLDRELFPIVCDCGAGSPQLRRASQRCLQEIQNGILESVEHIAGLNGLAISKAQRNKIRSFFWASAAAVGFLNAWRGRKHFTFSVDALEMIVLAMIPNGSEQPFERFVSDILYRKLGIAVGRHAAEKSGLVNSIDASIFEDNEEQLARQMIATGLVTQYSDATRMVGPRKTS